MINQTAGMKLSILIVSRTAKLVNTFCSTLNAATGCSSQEVEILLSWNGSAEEEAFINNTSRFNLRVAQRCPYHFAGNMNGLAQRACGDILMLANDDLELDPGCIDAGLEALTQSASTGLVGARLRDKSGQLTHAGIQFDSTLAGYHPLDRVVPADNRTLTPSGPVAAVTGALQWIRRNDFNKLKLNESYKVCGEDVELCLDVQEKLDLNVWLCNEASAIHQGETTRQTTPNQAANQDDINRLRARTEAFYRGATSQQLLISLQQQQRESQQLRDALRDEKLNLSALSQLAPRQAQKHSAAEDKHLDQQLTGPRPLSGQRFLVCAYELEQTEHRGIAVFTKGLLQAMKNAGAEIWLLSEYKPKPTHAHYKTLPEGIRKRILAAQVLDFLNTGEKDISADNPLFSLINQIPGLRRLTTLIKPLKQYKPRLKPSEYISENSLTTLPKEYFVNSPYERCERLSYLNNVDGFVCADYCFTDSMNLAKKRKGKVLTIELTHFDGLITTSPLNIQPKGTQCFVQTIHDLIPLEYRRTKDNLTCFTRRLQAAMPAKRLFVSKDAERNYNAAIMGASADVQERQIPRHHQVVVQSPSIHFPDTGKEWEAAKSTVQLMSYGGGTAYSLKSHSYLLFNSAVVPHKNLLFALRAFLESGVEDLGIRFCITGKPQQDDYSRSVEALASKHGSVIFSGYVDEVTKRQLFLNALALLSPSLIEGFGIPVLDAACLGIKTLASPLGSHQEIQAMEDFGSYIELIQTLNTSPWANAIRSIGHEYQQSFKNLSESAQDKIFTHLKRERIARYESIQQRINANLEENVSTLLSS